MKSLTMMIGAILAATLTTTMMVSVASAQRITPEMKTGCQQALNQRLARDNGGVRVQSNLKTWNDRPISNGQLGIVGEAEVSINNGQWRNVSYDCVYNTRSDYAESATYSFSGSGRGQGLGDSGGGQGGFGGWGGQNEQFLRTRCTEALERRLSAEAGIGFSRLSLVDVRSYGNPGQVSGLRGRAEASFRNNRNRPLDFDCRINSRNGNVENLDFSWQDGGGWNGNQPGNRAGNLGGGGGWEGNRGGGLDNLPGFEMRPGGPGGNQIDLRMYVDGMVDIFIRGDRVRYRVNNGQEPGDEGSEYGQPLPRRDLFCRVEKKDGRADIRVIEQPSRSNNYTLHLQIDDRKGGSDHYHARIKW